MKKYLAVLVCVIGTFSTTSVSAFTPDLIKGCSIIANGKKDTSGMDAVNAAYCLGVLDGILASTFKRQINSPLPDPCFDKRTIQPSEIARQVVLILNAKPELLEMSRRMAADRGGLATYLALSFSYKCEAPIK